MILATTDDLRARAERAREWMFTRAFPLWSLHGVDGDGYFLENLDSEGVGIADSRRRIRVQARQTFSFALARALGWRQGRSGELAGRGARMLIDRCALPDGLYGTWLDTGSGPLDGYCLYDSAFALLALSWAAYALKDESLFMEAVALARRIDQSCSHGEGGFRETNQVGRPRLQNPHMHLYEASLAHASLTGDADSAERAAGIGSFVMSRFWDKRIGGIREERAEAGIATEDRIEAGHQYEWTWLLHASAAVSGIAVSPRAGEIYRRGLALTEGDGRIMLSHRSDGMAHGTNRRMWCQCEAIKAHLVRAAAGDDAAVGRACRSFDLLWSDHICADGVWIDTRDKEGKRVGDMVPASTGYHIYLALAALMRATGLPEAADIPIAPAFGSVV